MTFDILLDDPGNLGVPAHILLMVAQLADFLRHVVEVLRNGRIEYALLALSLYVVSLLIGGARWKRLLAGMGGRVSIGQTTLINLAGIGVNNVTPSSRIGGDVCRIFLMRGRTGLTLEQLAASTLFEKISDVPVIAVLVVVSLPTLALFVTKIRRFWWSSYALLVVGAVAGCLAIVALLRGSQGLARVRARLAACLVSWRALAFAAGCSTLLWFQDVLRLMSAAAACRTILAPQQAATLSVLTLMAGAVPSVGGLGVVEGGLFAGLLSFGINARTAAAITAVEWSISYGFATAAGWAAITWLGGRRILRGAKAAAISSKPG
ncbi:MAG TPA: lysylphosphatidylglycerol synthase transmembrane domain-containing protein [Vicinamibacterales bacterium]|nr:lysylphosphatidylglycerol synthase transmembrane domain-containing protein [Vicinamibacterales bacterium]